MTIDTERGAQVRWRDGVLEALWFEADWVTSTTAQVLSETLTELLSRAPHRSVSSVPDRLSDARTDLEMFLR